MRTNLLGFSVTVVLLTSIPGAAWGQMRCKDLTDDELVTYTKPTFIFTVDYPESMTWVMDLGDSEVKFRTMPPGIVGFKFKHSEKPTVADNFDRSVDGWSEGFTLDYGDSEVLVWAAPHNGPKAAEYRALLPHGGAQYEFSALLETGEFGCDELDRRTDIEAAIRSLKPNPETTR